MSSTFDPASTPDASQSPLPAALDPAALPPALPAAREQPECDATLASASDIGGREGTQQARGMRNRMLGLGIRGGLRTGRKARALWTLWLGGLLASAIALDTAQANATPQAVRVSWRGQSFEVGDWPSSLTRELQELVLSWSGWAGAMHYRMDLESSGRVLLLTAEDHSSVAREMKLASRTLEFFDQRLELPESTEFTVLAEAVPLRAGTDECVVLLRLANRRDLISCLDVLTEDHPYLSPWSGTAKDGTGFSLQQPLCGAWLESERGDEDWQPDNELVSRLGLGLLRSRFGRQPHWLEEGLCWQAEQELLGSIWCFPGRDDHVAADEHNGWARELRSSFRAGRDEPLGLALLCDWPRDTWSDEAAAASWGLVGYLMKYEPRSLAPIAIELGAHWQSFGRVTRPDGSWRRIADFEVPAPVQFEILQRHAGQQSLAEAAEFFRRGRAYRPGPAR